MKQGARNERRGELLIDASLRAERARHLAEPRRWIVLVGRCRLARRHDRDDRKPELSRLRTHRTSPVCACRPKRLAPPNDARIRKGGTIVFCITIVNCHTSSQFRRLTRFRSLRPHGAGGRQSLSPPRRVRGGAPCGATSRARRRGLWRGLRPLPRRLRPCTRSRAGASGRSLACPSRPSAGPCPSDPTCTRATCRAGRRR